GGARALEPRALVVGIGVAVEQERRRDHVLARGQQRAHLVEVGAARHVEHAVGVRRQQRIAAPGRAHTGRRGAAEVPRVAPFLLRRVHPHARELELGMIEHGAERFASDRSGSPLDHAVGGHAAQATPDTLQTQCKSPSVPRVKVLVTGATGLIGCHAAARLAQSGHAVRALVRDAGKLRRVLAPFSAAGAVEAQLGDVTDPASVEAALRGCDALLHCAGLFSHQLADAKRLHTVNVRGAELVMNAACKAGLARVVFVSSALALFPPAGPVLRGADPVSRPSGMDGSTKADAERRARELQAGGSPIVIVYPASVLGPHDPTVGSGPGVMASALRAGRVVVTDGGLTYTDVRDLADLFAAVLVAAHPPPRVM